MSRCTKVMSCSPEAVFDVLSDGWTYATWVVGAARIRRVDEGFPEPGAAVHHSVGAWPLLLSDVTEVEHVDPPHEIVLRAKTWPAGEALVRVSCQGSDGRTEVELEEYAVAGPAALVPRPVESLLLRARNQETLRRLAYLAESGARSRTDAESGARSQTDAE
jgi:uncharacterized protein YndB with AHSA1/START domain